MGAFPQRIYMPFKDDNYVDFSKKQRVYRSNSKISPKYARFSPEDLGISDYAEDTYVNASVNKDTYEMND